ncbi:trehalose-phosphatase [Bordetella genomosp. 11]|uniref:Trehalose 6-phosphate phosphatase n=1 Tax=Bordetella genomosp. 11 TaxID=1416808 RepID=A0A261UPS6_9BORD|nr:trehalose-phosphatase [Bordetella genomosp. 11]
MSIPVSKDNVGRHALLFDLDGTLAPIAATPQQAHVPAETIDVLERLGKVTGGAVAIVSGRPLAQIDALVHPLVLPGAGLHGAQWREPDGTLHEMPVDTAAVARMVESLAPLAERWPGTQLEHKGLSLAFHYRNAPDLEQEVRIAADMAMQPHADRFVLQPGKMVVEIKPRHASKAAAISRLMGMAPFAGRVPVFAGDDLTDEAGFQAVKAIGGVTIKIGEGDSVADWRFPTPAALAGWLALL